MVWSFLLSGGVSIVAPLKFIMPQKRLRSKLFSQGGRGNGIALQVYESEAGSRTHGVKGIIFQQEFPRFDHRFAAQRRM